MNGNSSPSGTIELPEEPMHISGRRLQAVLAPQLVYQRPADHIDRAGARQALVTTLMRGHRRSLPQIVQDVFATIPQEPNQPLENDPYLQAAEALAAVIMRDQVNNPYHNPAHVGDVLYAMQGAALKAGADAHEQKVGIVTALVHDFEHNGHLNRQPWENETTALINALPHINGLPPEDQQIISNATMSSDYFNPSAAPFFRQQYQRKIETGEEIPVGERLTARLLDSDIVNILDPELNRVASAEMAVEITNTGIPVRMEFDEGDVNAHDTIERISSRLPNLPIEQRLEFVRSAQFITLEFKALGAREGLQQTIEHLTSQFQARQAAEMPVNRAPVLID